jgi:preprotein translocase subunit SecF
MLTILGYSLYDTVVVFDKIRENTANLDDYQFTYAEAANKSVNQVLVRSINTTIIGVLPVAAILFAGAFILGSGPLEDIGLALFVGMIIAAYSSLFIATPLLSQLKMREPEMKLQAVRVAKKREKQAKADSSHEKQPTKKAARATSVEVVSMIEADDYIRTQPTKTSRAQRTKS